MQSRPVAVVTSVTGEDQGQTITQLQALVDALTDTVQATDPGDLTVVFDNHLI